MNIPLFPVQKSGILAVGAAAIALVLVIAWQLALPGQTVPDPAKALETMPMTLLFLAALASVAVSFVSGLIAILKDREYALAVFFSVILSAFGLFYGVWSLVSALGA